MAEMLGDPPERARVLAVSHDEADLHQGFEFRIEGTPCSLIVDARLREHPRGHHRALPRRRLHRPPRAGLLPRRGDARQLRRRRSATSACSRAGAWSPTPTSAPPCRSSAPAPRRRSSAAATRSRCAPARPRSRPRACGSSRRPTRSAGASGATCTTAPSSASSRSATCSRWPSAGWPTEPDSAGALLDQAREQAALAGDELRELVRGLHPAGLAEHGLGHALPRWPRARRCRCASTRCPSAGCPGRSRRRSTTWSPRR